MLGSGSSEDQASVVVSAVWKAVIRTMIKLLDIPIVLSALLESEAEKKLDSDVLVSVMIEARVDPVDHSEEE
jgi:hypothetical protein